MSEDLLGVLAAQRPQLALSAALALLDAGLADLLALIAVLRAHVAGSIGLQALGRAGLLGVDSTSRHEDT